MHKQISGISEIEAAQYPIHTVSSAIFLRSCLIRLPQNCLDAKETAIPTELLGHKIFVKVLETYRKDNGQYGVRVMDKPYARNLWPKLLSLKMTF